MKKQSSLVRVPYVSETTEFLNVDLDLYSQANLQPLVDALGQKVDVCYVGKQGRRFGAHLELSLQPKTADEAIRRFVVLIRKLPKAARRFWDQARVRDFNIGVQAAPRPHSFELPVAAQTIKAVAELNARIVVTIYAPEKSLVTRPTS